MNNKLLLIQGITLLYRESQLANLTDNSAKLVKQVLSTIKLPEHSLGVSQEKDILNGLMMVAMQMCENPITHRYEASERMQCVRISCLDDEDLFEAVYDGIGKELSEDDVKIACKNLRHTLEDYLNELTFAKMLEQYAYEYKFKRAGITNIRAFAGQMATALEPYMGQATDDDPAILSDVSSDKPGQMAKVYKEIKEIDSGARSLICGYQGVNRMLGGKFKRGALITVSALQHNYKTGFCLSLFAGFALFNVPVLTNPARKPVLVHISFEDDHDLTFNFLYKMLMENETGRDCSMDGLTPEEIEVYVRNRLEATGYHTRFLRVNPSAWTYRDVQDKILQIESEGYEVHVCLLDYLLKLPTTGCDGTAAGEALRNLFEKMRNFMSARGITLITPHQLSTEAKIKLREGENEFVKSLVGMGYYAGSKQLDQVIDIEFFIHKEIVNNVSFLAIQRGKQRGRIGQPIASEVYIALQFGINCIPFDIGLPDSTRKKPGAGVLGSVDEVAFWDTAEID